MDILAAVRKLRDAGRTILTAYVDHRAPPGWAIQVIREHYYAALAQADVALQLPLRHHVLVDGPEQIVPLLGLALGDLSSRGYDLERLRRCADQDCGWFFIDTSRNRTRRWCDPDDCGNRNRVKAFVARHRPAALESDIGSHPRPTAFRDRCHRWQCRTPPKAVCRSAVIAVPCYISLLPRSRHDR